MKHGTSNEDYEIRKLPSSSLSTQCSHHVHEFPKMRTIYPMQSSFSEIRYFLPIGSQGRNTARRQQQNSPSEDI